MEIKIREMAQTDTLRHRDTARNIIERVDAAPDGAKIVLDFQGITFASKSFMHELLSSLKDRQVEYRNVSDEVRMMIGIAFMKPHVRLDEEDVKKIEALIP
jgi:anti-anti-sigma regulatory factor